MKWLIPILLLVSITSKAQFLKDISPISDSSVTLSVLLVSHNVLQLADIGTSIYAMNHGCHEDNPLFKDRFGLAVAITPGYCLLTNYLAKEIFKDSPTMAYIFGSLMSSTEMYAVGNNIHVIINL